MRSSKTKDTSCTDQNSHWDRITLDTCGEKIHVGWQTISIYSTTALLCRDELVDETLVWERMQLSFYHWQNPSSTQGIYHHDAKRAASHFADED